MAIGALAFWPEVQAMMASKVVEARAAGKRIVHLGRLEVRRRIR